MAIDGEKLKNIIWGKELSIASFAISLGCKYPTSLGKYLNEKNRMPPELFDQVIKALEISPETILKHP